MQETKPPVDNPEVVTDVVPVSNPEILFRMLDEISQQIKRENITQQFLDEKNKVIYELREIFDKLYVNPRFASQETQMQIEKSLIDLQSDLLTAKENNNINEIQKLQDRIQNLKRKAFRFGNIIFNLNMEEKQVILDLERISNEKIEANKFLKMKILLENQKQELRRIEIYESKNDIVDSINDIYNDTLYPKKRQEEIINKRLNELQQLLQESKRKGDFQNYTKYENEIEDLSKQAITLGFSINQLEFDKKHVIKYFLQKAANNSIEIFDQFQEIFDQFQDIAEEQLQDRLDSIKNFLSTVDDRIKQLDTKIRKFNPELLQKLGVKNIQEKKEEHLDAIEELKQITKAKTTFQLEKRLTEVFFQRYNLAKDRKTKYELLRKFQQQQHERLSKKN